MHFHHFDRVGIIPPPGVCTGIAMNVFMKFLDRPHLIALVPALAVLFDYSMTIAFSGSSQAIMAFEYSPILRTAVANGLVLPCIAMLALGYYGLGLVALGALRGSRYYPFGVVLLLIIGVTHVSGGFSWLVRSTVYSHGVLLLAASGIIVAVAAFAIALKARRAGATVS